MKPTLLDRLIGYVNPEAGYRRVRARAIQEMSLRAYDAAKTYSTSDWVSASGTSANAEIGPAQKVLREKARDLARNNPYSVRAIDVIVNNTVGAGIEARIKGRNKTQTKKLTELWKQVTESTACDAEGQNNFRALQSLAMRAIVESGEVIGLKEISLDGPKIRLLETDYLVSDKDDGNIVQGIEIDKSGKPVRYHLYKKHPGDKRTSTEIMVVEADRVAHAFKKQRPGQKRGVAWSHAVIEKLKDFDDYQQATLIRQKIAACFAAFITTNDSNSLMDASTLKARREAEMQLSPASVKYLNQGEDVKLASPPGVDGYSEFTRENMRAVAAGYGVSYEAMTGDYSQVNFSSGRMGHIEFRRNIDSWRWNILIPHFCQHYFEWFLEYAKLKGHDIQGVTVEWTPPAHTMIDPSKEIAADKEAVKAGFKSRRRVIREQGDDPEAVEQEIKEEREAAKSLGLIFDTDTPVTPKAEVSNSEQDKEDAPDESDSGGDQ